MDPATAWLIVFLAMVAVFFLAYRETRKWKSAAIASSILGKTGAYNCFQICIASFYGVFQHLA